MARLNDGPSATEEAELIKRRVMRQNHELAKANSRLAQAIRSATSDTTRVEAENLELRETIIHLETELAATQGLKGLSRVDQIKSDLQAKLDDMAGLIASIGLAQTPYTESRSRRRTSYGSREPQLRFAMQPYGLSPISESNALPQVSDDNDHSGAGRVSDQSLDSSDFEERPLSPFKSISLSETSPTKSFLVHTDDNDRDALREDLADDSNTLPTDLSINLEVRRKRKDSGRSSSGRTSLPSLDAEEKPFKIPKRKLSMREVDDAASEVADKDFTYSIRHTAEVQSEQIVAPAINEDLGWSDEKSDDPAPKVERKVLGEKSVNVSPKKRAVAANADEKRIDQSEPNKDDRGKTEKKRPTKSSRVVKKSVEKNEGLVTVMQVGHAGEMVPKIVEILPSEAQTPLSEAVVKAPERAPTPPPAAATSIDTTVSLPDTGSRPSRRARGSVSYAEPSLNTKMRRPTKDLVAAVYSKTNDRKSVSSGLESADIIKTEVVENDSWKDLPLATRRRSSLPRQSTSRRSVSSGSAHGQGPDQDDDAHSTRQACVHDDIGDGNDISPQDAERTGGSPNIRPSTFKARRHTSQLAVPDPGAEVSAIKVSTGTLRRSLSNSEQQSEVKTHSSAPALQPSRRRSTMV